MEEQRDTLLEEKKYQQQIEECTYSLDECSRIVISIKNDTGKRQAIDRKQQQLRERKGCEKLFNTQCQYVHNIF